MLTRTSAHRKTVQGLLPYQLRCLHGAARYKIIYGGRGSGKSWGVGRVLLRRGAQKPLRILCAREFQNSLADSVQRLLAEQIEQLQLTGFYRVGKASIQCGNGTEFLFTGLRHNVSKIKSFEGVDIVWVEEGQTVSKHSFDVLIPTIRKPGSEIWVTFNPDLEQDDVWRRFLVFPPPRAVVQRINWSDNPWFPEELRAEKDHLKARDFEAYENVWEGHCRSHVQGALWTKAIFEANRETRRAPKRNAVALNTMRRVVIAIDPSGCAGEDDHRSDEIGIVAAGVGHDGTGRILEDATGRYRRTGGRAKHWNCSTAGRQILSWRRKTSAGRWSSRPLRTARRTAPVKLLNASRGKVQRAEPVAALYAQGKVRHVGISRNWSGSTACSRRRATGAHTRRITPMRESGPSANCWWNPGRERVCSSIMRG